MVPSFFQLDLFFAMLQTKSNILTTQTGKAYRHVLEMSSLASASTAGQQRSIECILACTDKPAFTISLPDTDSLGFELLVGRTSKSEGDGYSSSSGICAFIKADHTI